MVTNNNNYKSVEIKIAHMKFDGIITSIQTDIIETIPPVFLSTISGSFLSSSLNDFEGSFEMNITGDAKLPAETLLGKREKPTKNWKKIIK